MQSELLAYRNEILAGEGPANKTAFGRRTNVRPELTSPRQHLSNARCSHTQAAGRRSTCCTGASTRWLTQLREKQPEAPPYARVVKWKLLPPARKPRTRSIEHQRMSSKIRGDLHSSRVVHCIPICKLWRRSQLDRHLWQQPCSPTCCHDEVGSNRSRTQIDTPTSSFVHVRRLKTASVLPYIRPT